MGDGLAGVGCAEAFFDGVELPRLNGDVLSHSLLDDPGFGAVEGDGEGCEFVVEGGVEAGADLGGFGHGGRVGSVGFRALRYYTL